jgi:hypothetical protein
MKPRLGHLSSETTHQPLHAAARRGAASRRASPASWAALLLLLLGPVPPSAEAQGPGADGPLVLRTAHSVRAAGLGGAGAALMGDAGSVFSNPAGLALVHHVALEAGFFGGPLDAYQATAALGLRVLQFDLGLGLKYYEFGSEPEIVPDPATAGVTGVPTGASVSAGEFLGVGSLVYRFGLLALGGSVKLARQDVADVHARGVSGDLGLAIAVFDILALAVAVQNLSGNWDGQGGLDFPRLTRAGFTMNYVDPQESWRLLSTIELQWPEARSTRLVLGLEGGVVVRGVGVLGRTAYRSLEEGADVSHFTFGLSLNLARLTVDYAYEPTSLLGDGSQRIGLRLTL